MLEEERIPVTPLIQIEFAMLTGDGPVNRRIMYERIIHVYWDCKDQQLEPLTSRLDRLICNASISRTTYPLGSPMTPDAAQCNDVP